MIRTSNHILKFSNKNKLEIIDKIYFDCKLQVQEYVDQIIYGKLELKQNLSSKYLSSEYIIQSHWKNICYNTAYGIIKSQSESSSSKRFRTYKKIYTKLKLDNRYTNFTSKKFSELKLKPIYQTKYFTKPKLNNINLILDQRIIDFSTYSKSFDCFINLTVPFKIKGKENQQRHSYQKINIPIKHHKHSNLLRRDITWKLKNSINLQKVNSNYYFVFYWEKELPIKKFEGKIIGFDCGYKKLLISSENKIYDDGLERIYNKINRKKQGSKNFKQALVERDNLINQSLNKIDITNIKTIVVEDLKNVKHKSKFRKKFNNKLQRWSYLKVLDKLSMLTDEAGINLIKVNPAYTSQTCSKCGSIHKENRNGIVFHCIDCGYEIDADYNASINILHRGVFNPSTTEKPRGN